VPKVKAPAFNFSLWYCCIISVKIHLVLGRLCLLFPSWPKIPIDSSPLVHLRLLRDSVAVLFGLQLTAYLALLLVFYVGSRHSGTVSINTSACVWWSRFNKRKLLNFSERLVDTLILTYLHGVIILEDWNLH
jgi:hypothetical protein